MDEKLIKDIIKYIDEENKEEFKLFGIMYYRSGNKDFVEETKKIMNKFEIPKLIFKKRSIDTDKYDLKRNFIVIDVSSCYVNIYDYESNKETLKELNLDINKKKCIGIITNGL